MEKRKFKRIDKTMAVQIEDSYGMSVDLSKGGMKIIPDHLPKKFDRIRISFITEEGELIELSGSIARIVDKKEKEGNYQLGIAFAEIPESYSKYIDSLEKQESSSGMFQEDVRQDLVKAVLEGKEEDLSLPTAEKPEAPPAAKETPPPSTGEFPLEDIANIHLDDVLPEDEEPAADETAAVPLESPPINEAQVETADNIPPIPKETPQEILNIPLEEMMQEEPEEPPEISLPPQMPAADETVAVPLEELEQEEEKQELPVTPGPDTQESTPDETIVMPVNRLPYQSPLDGVKKTPDDKKKNAPQRVEVSFEEFLQKNPQIVKKNSTPQPISKKPAPEDEKSLDKVFQEGAEPDAGGKSAVPPTLDEQTLDKVFQEDQQPPPPDIPDLDQDDDLSLDGIFSDKTEPGTTPKSGGEQEDDTSLDKIFQDQENK